MIFSARASTALRSQMESFKKPQQAADNWRSSMNENVLPGWKRAERDLLDDDDQLASFILIIIT